MKTIWVIFKKEIKELFRDRKSLFMMIGFPILILPILLTGSETGKSDFEPQVEHL